jgi:hypothetical protein
MPANFLKTDHISIYRAQNRCNPPHIQAAIRADTIVDVPGRQLKTSSEPGHVIGHEGSFSLETSFSREFGERPVWATLMGAGQTLYPFVFTQFPSRQMNSFGSKLL